PALLLAALLAAVLIPSCGKGRKELYPVRTKVFVDNKPAADVFINLHPVDKSEPGRTASFGRTDANGEVTLSTFVAGDGVPEGEYVVTFTWRERSGLLKDQFEGPDRLKGQYYDLKTSKFRVTVQPKPNELPPFYLKIDSKKGE